MSEEPDKARVEGMGTFLTLWALFVVEKVGKLGKKEFALNNALFAKQLDGIIQKAAQEGLDPVSPIDQPLIAGMRTRRKESAVVANVGGFWLSLCGEFEDGQLATRSLLLQRFELLGQKDVDLTLPRRANIN